MADLVTTGSSKDETFDGFAGDGLDRWSVLEVPVGDGRVQRHEDANASVIVDKGAVEIDIPRFSLSFDGSHMLDGPKQMFVAKESFQIPAGGSARFGVEMGAENHGGNADDPRDAIATFNLVEFDSGLVFDVAMSSKHVWAIRERLPVPGVDVEETFSYLVESPFADLEPARKPFHTCALEFDAAQRAVRWEVDGSRIYHADGIDPFPTEVTVCFAIITLHPQPNCVSTSIRGQGMRARWRRFSYRGKPG